MKHFLREIKWAYQRIRYGYDDTIKWGFSDYFNQCIKPLKEFCEEELKNIYECKGNEKRKEIFEETLKRIKAFQNMKVGDSYKEVNQESLLWEYVGKNIGWYWN